MSFSYNLGANPSIDYPRVLIGDTVDLNHIFEDEEITSAYAIDAIQFALPVTRGVLTAAPGTPSYRRCAATLLDCLASNKARLAGVNRVLDIQIDLSKAADALKTQAEYLRDVEANSGAFGIAEMCTTIFASRERLQNQLLRLYAAG